MRREKGKADFFCEGSAFFFSENVWNVSSENHIFMLSFSRRISFPVHFSSFHVIFFLRKLLWNRLAGAWGRSLQRYLKRRWVILYNNRIEILRDFLIGAVLVLLVYHPHQTQGQVNHFYASFCSLIKQITKAGRRLTEERVSFLPFVSLPRASILHHWRGPPPYR